MRLYNTYNLIRLKRLSIVAVLSMVLSLIGFFEVNAQNVFGWDKIYGASNGPDVAFAVVEMQDKGYVTVGYSNSFGNSNEIYTIRTDIDGTVLWTNLEGTTAAEEGMDLTISSDQNGVVIVGNGNDLVNGGKDVILFKLNDEGEKLWTKFFSTNADNDDVASGITTTNDGGYIITGYTEDETGDKQVFLWKVDADGTEEFREFFGGPLDDFGTAVIQKPNGNFVVTGRTEVSNGNFNIIILEVNSNGDVIIVNDNFGTTEFEGGNDLVLAPNGNVFITGQSGGQSDVGLLEINSLGGVENFFSFGDGTTFDVGNEIVVTDDDNLMIVGFNELDATDINCFLLKVDASNGNEIFRKSIGQNQFLEFGEGITTTSNGGFVIAGTRTNPFGIGEDIYLIKTNGNGDLLTNHITGRAFRDANNDCSFQNSETSVRNWIVEARGANRTYYGSVDANGNFDIQTDTGSYEVNIIIPNVYWNSITCQTPNFQVDLPQLFDSVSLDYPIQTEIVCPVMEVDVSTSRIIPCEDNIYRVEFCNQGTEIAVGAQVELIFEKNLNVISSSLPSILVDDSLHVFAIGNIDVGECGFFEVTVNADCATVIENEAHCVEARITPDATCLSPNPGWDGAELEVNSYCDGDSVIFEIRNIGSGTMDQGSDFIVTEDIVLLQQPAPTSALAVGEVQRLAFLADGKHYRLIVNQTPDHPGRNFFATASVEACDPNNTGSSLGFVTQIEEADRDSYQSKDCIENQLSFDAIDFIGYPKGYQDTCSMKADLITSLTDLKYHIRFQNVGIDTSGRVVIRDTVPSNLDITSIRPGASSHPYTFEAYRDGIVKFTFSGLEQPDSTTNELLSHGFVKYRISQKPNNPVGTIIENGGIVFQDYNAPTNTALTRHEVGGDQIAEILCFVTSDQNPDFPNASIEVYPNPFNNFTKIEVKGEDFQNMDFHVFDIAGKKVRTEKFDNNTLEFYRNQLPQGLYVFTIEVEGLVVQSGKLIIQ